MSDGADAAGAPIKEASAATDARVGVVIPVYNGGDLVLGAATSAIRALGARENIVVVDDGSNQKATLAALERVRELGLRVIRQANGGVSTARNAGLGLLTTPYAFVLDADDELALGAPNIAAEVLDGDEDVVIVAGGGIDVLPDGREVDRGAPGALTRETMRNHSMIATASAFRLADWRRVGGFPAGIAMGEDWVFWMRLLRDGGAVRSVGAPFVRRHIHDQQVTRGYIDPRKSAAARNLVLTENPDLAAAYIDETVDELVRVRSLLAEYRHRHRRIDSLKRFARRLLERRVPGQ